MPGGDLEVQGTFDVDRFTAMTGASVLYVQSGIEAQRLDRHVLLVDQTVWTNGDIEAGNGARFVSGGIFEISSDHSFLGDALGGTTRFDNDDTIRKIGGTGTTTLRVCYAPGPFAIVEEQQGTVAIVSPSGCP